MTAADLIALLTRVQTALLASELRARGQMWAELNEVIAKLREEQAPCSPT